MRILLLLLVAWLGWAALVFLLQRRFIYPGAYMDTRRVADGGPPAGAERLWFEHADGRAEAWWFPAHGTEAEPASALVFFHGNAELIDDWPRLLQALPDSLGVSLLLVEYPGYGRSTGTPTRATILEVATQAWDSVAARPEVDPARMVVMGRSLGGGPAAELARVREPAALVLQSTFTDIGRLAGRHSFVPASLIRDRWRPVEAVRAFEGPVLVFHGRLDRVIPYGHGEALAAARDRVRFETMECGHNDCPPPGDVWWATLREFLSEAGVVR